jgi:hypothetical protein
MADPNPQRAVLQKAWDSLPAYSSDPATPASRDALKQFRLESPEVDQFCVDALGVGTGPRSPRGARIRARMSMIYAAQPARACIWMIVASRRLRDDAFARGAMLATQKMERYQEWVQYMCFLLHDQRGDSSPFTPPSAPVSVRVYRDRRCDIAYRSLCAQLKNVEGAEAIATDAGWETPFQPPRSNMPHPERNKQIAGLIKTMSSVKIRKIVQGWPSAIRELQKKNPGNTPDAMTEHAIALLSRMSPRIMADDLLPAKPVSLKQILKKEYPEWSEKEKRYIKRAQKPEYPAKGIITGLQQYRRRSRGLARWVLLLRTDRSVILAALIEAYNQDDFRDVRSEILDLLDEMNQTGDKSQKATIGEFLKKIAEDKNQAWFLRQRAQRAIATHHPLPTDFAPQSGVGDFGDAGGDEVAGGDGGFGQGGIDG